jgi:hypothetical protein
VNIVRANGRKPNKLEDGAINKELKVFTYCTLIQKIILSKKFLPPKN